MRDQETIKFLPLLAFNIIPQRSHSLALARSRFRDSATLTPGDGTTANKVESSAQQIRLLSIMEKSSEVYRSNNKVNQFTPTIVHHNVL